MDKRVILKELLIANKENPIRAAKLIIANEEKQKRSDELVIGNAGKERQITVKAIA